MELENTAIRLKKIMQEKNLRQVDLLEMVKPFCEKYNVKINKSDISQYLSGKVKPGQEKLSMLGMALGVTESWLMGYDSPKEKAHHIEALTLSKEEKTLLENYNKLNSKGKEKLLDYSDDLTTNIKYMDNSNNEITATIDNVTNVDFNSNNKDDDEEVFVPYKSLDEIDGCNAARADNLTPEQLEHVKSIILELENKRKLEEFNKRKNK